MLGENNGRLTNHAPNPSLKIELIPAIELLNPSRRSLLHNLNDLLNDAYVATDSAAVVTDDNLRPVFSRPRIGHEDQLVSELGTNGLIAICTDPSLSNVTRDTTTWQINMSHGYQSGKYGTLVATAAISPWKGRVVERVLQALAEAEQRQNGSIVNAVDVAEVHRENDENITGKGGATFDWEVKTCASCNDPKYRGKGLITQCLDTLIQRLLAERQESCEIEAQVSNPKLKLWISALEGSENPKYWMRRGFVKEGEGDVAPKGVWGSDREFKIQTLGKMIV